MLAATILTAAATTLLALLGVGALWSIRETRKGRELQLMLELNQRWDSKDMVEVRALIESLHRAGKLDTEIRRLYQSTSPSAEEMVRYFNLLKEPGFIEDLAILYYRKAVSLELLRESMGLIIPERWDRWCRSAHFLQGERGRATYKNFKDLARELRMPTQRWDTPLP